MKNLIITTLFSLLLFTSCDLFQNNPEDTLQKEIFSGYIQKGPFTNGSSLTISILDNHLNQTGQTYLTTVSDNSGSFEQKNIKLASNYVLLKADGFYFNEVSGSLSGSQLTLYAIADISEVNSANVNVLTHLERSRVEYLVKEQSLKFSDAKKQAQREVLAIFNLTMPDNQTSESLNLSNSGNDNAILLAISAILQGPSTTASMSELMANIISDIKTDGRLDNATLGSQLYDNARLISLTKVRENTVSKYTELGLNDVNIPDFEQYIDSFLSKNTYESIKKITYPVTGSKYLNILNDSVSYFSTSGFYSINADLPEGTSLRIVMKGNKYAWSYVAIPAPLNWTVNAFDSESSSQEFIVNESNKANEIFLNFTNTDDTIQIEYYENMATVPTRTRQIIREGIITQPPATGTFIYPEMGFLINYYNILNDSTKTTYQGKIYCIYAVQVPSQEIPLKVVFKGATKSWIINPQNETPLGWSIGNYDASSGSQTLTKLSGKSETTVTFPQSYEVTIEFYENNELTPKRIKILNSK